MNEPYTGESGHVQSMSEGDSTPALRFPGPIRLLKDTPMKDAPSWIHEQTSDKEAARDMDEYAYNATSGLRD